jgi:hypothetical protein
MDQLRTLCGSLNAAIKIGGSRVIVGNWSSLTKASSQASISSGNAARDLILPRRPARQKLFF